MRGGPERIGEQLFYRYLARETAGHTGFTPTPSATPQTLCGPSLLCPLELEPNRSGVFPRDLLPFFS